MPGMALDEALNIMRGSGDVLAAWTSLHTSVTGECTRCRLPDGSVEVFLPNARPGGDDHLVKAARFVRRLRAKKIQPETFDRPDDSARKPSLAVDQAPPG